MKAVALLVLYAGYVLVAYGVNHVTGGCVSFKDTLLPVGGQVSDPCNGTTSTMTKAVSSAAPSNGKATTGQVSGASFPTQQPLSANAVSGYNPSPSGNAYTLPSNPGPGGYTLSPSAQKIVNRGQNQ